MLDLVLWSITECDVGIYNAISKSVRYFTITSTMLCLSQEFCGSHDQWAFGFEKIRLST